MIYQKLIEAYNQLSNTDKTALLLYKSRIGRAINSLDNNLQEINEIYQSYKELLKDPKNAFMKFTIFQNIDWDSQTNFIKSIQRIAQQLESILLKLQLSENITVYRIVSLPKDTSLPCLSKGNIVSTSLDINQCFKFLIPNKNYQHYLFQINLETDSKVAICPYSILINQKTEQLTLSTEVDQKEIILSKNNFDFTVQETSTIKLDNKESLNVILLDAKQKSKEKFESNSKRSP